MNRLEQQQERALIDRMIIELTEFIHRKHQALDKIHLLQKQRTLIFEKVREDETKLVEFLAQLRGTDFAYTWDRKDVIIKEGKDFGRLLKVEIELMEFLRKLKQLEIDLQNKMLDWHKEEIIPDNIITSLWDLVVKKPEVGHVRDESEFVSKLVQTKEIGTLRIIEILYNVDKRFEVLLKREEELFEQEEIGLLIRDKFETARRLWHNIENYNKEETELISLLNEKLIIQNTTLARMREQLKIYESDLEAKRALKIINAIDKIIDEIEDGNFDGAQRLIRENAKQRLFNKEQAKAIYTITALISLHEFENAQNLLNSKEIKPHLAPKHIQRLLNIVSHPESYPLILGYPWKLEIKSPSNDSIQHIGYPIEHLEAEVISGPNMEAINADRVDYLQFRWSIEQIEPLMQDAPLMQALYARREGSSEPISPDIFKHHSEPQQNKAKLIVQLVNTRTNKAVGVASIEIYIGELGRIIAPLKVEIIFPRKNSTHIIGWNIDLAAKVKEPNGNEINYREYNLKFSWWLFQSKYKMLGRQKQENRIYEGRTGNSEPIPSNFELGKYTKLAVDLHDISGEEPLLISSDEIDIALALPGLRINLMDAVRRERTLLEKINARFRILRGRRSLKLKIKEAEQLAKKAAEELKKVSFERKLPFIDRLLFSLSAIPDDVLRGMASELKYTEQQRVRALGEAPEQVIREPLPPEIKQRQPAMVIDQINRARFRNLFLALEAGDAAPARNLMDEIYRSGGLSEEDYAWLRFTIENFENKQVVLARLNLEWDRLGRQQRENPSEENNFLVDFLDAIIRMIEGQQPPPEPEPRIPPPEAPPSPPDRAEQLRMLAERIRSKRPPT